MAARELDGDDAARPIIHTLLKLDQLIEAYSGF
jgi:hypothetical protein